MLKKILITLIILVTLGIMCLCAIIINDYFKTEKREYKSINISDYSQSEYEFDIFDDEYEVLENESIIGTFKSYEEAYSLCLQTKNSIVRRKGTNNNLYENIQRYYVSSGNKEQAFANISEAYIEADKTGGKVYDSVNKKYIYERSAYKGSYIISGVPFIGQYPQLHRGCEITSLCMLLNYKGIITDKLRLAEQIFKDNTPYSEKNGIKIYGNPNIGFVGDIYSKENKGYGVYHKPVYNLLLDYCPQTALDLTGAKPRHIYYYIDRNCPVWVIINTKFAPLPKESFEKWYTSQGEIMITYSEHSVLVTGYDNSYVYFNDPMHPHNTQKAKRSDFESAWEQMGSQAITIF